ncbi:AMP-dependent ligase [Thalassobacillus devorans]|uniref:AMP-dependent ligase n=1 Tax=Thalassobacillus devorans TaxID=279813 RepID=A0ABQ1P2J3_9BACI|nr:class I adenylate-forming enzyme family protein [Thalassobacillus devorans]NIK28023.1 acyl-CoA synthetase (AMP-forming)/AMP-acid ligase II [Thalassobacillus devorans]GGC89514.1 AMP-dependent ligase [Thalassobacillus devorans]
MNIQEIDLYGRPNVKVFADRPENINSILSKHLDTHADKKAIVTEGHALSYKQLDKDSTAMAAYLQKNCNVEKGDRVATLIGNRHHFPIVLFACMKIGAIMVPINVKLSADEVEYILAHSDIKVIISEDRYFHKIAELRQHTEKIIPPDDHLFIIDGTNSFEKLLTHDYPLTKVQVDELDPAFILYTSGTTGRPKGAVLTHINIIHSLINYQVTFQTHQDMKTLIAVPMFHVTGLVGQLLHLIYVGGTVYSMERYQNRKYIDYILEYKINFLFNVPTIFIMMSTEDKFLNNQFDFVTKVAFGGSPIYQETFSMLKKAFPNAQLHNAYGATETTSPATLMPVNYHESKVTSVGLAVPVADIKIVREDGMNCKPGEAGEMQIKGPMVVKEYWRNPEANTRNFTDGYWHSGDIGYMDEDGFFYIKDRKKDMINRGGEKIFSIEVEDVLKSHELIDEAAVVGVPDEVFGERVKAFIVGSSINEAYIEEIKHYCHSQLAKYKVPEVFEIIEELPRNSSGKILKNSLKESGGNGYVKRNVK